jgi:UDP-N-acetylmuramoyl-tripeptide--D-alanyl-D-alanine ligase
MKSKLSEVIRVTGCDVAGDYDPRSEVSGVIVDSRLAEPGLLFAAIAGTVRDGHDFIRDAARRGAFVLCSRADEDAGDAVQLVVPDVGKALVDVAAYNRDVVNPIVIGITGSLGKTATKDFTRAVASRKYPTVASEMSFNNEIGVPLTLLNADPGTEVLIAELGARGVGQIAELCDFVRPQVGIVTNVGVTHIEKFGSQDAIAETKAELIGCLPEGGTAILNADDELVMAMRGRTAAEVITFGLSPLADVRATDINVDSRGHARFRLTRGRETQPVELPFIGRHNVMNALAAAAAGIALGLGLDECKAGLQSAKSSPWRMEVSNHHGVTYVNDAWNANPDSVASALETSQVLVPRGGRFIAVLGYMAELGDISETEHRKVGGLASALATKLIVIGEKAEGIAEGARDAGMRDVTLVPDGHAALQLLRTLREGDVVLVKASRSERLESFVERIKGEVMLG